MKISTTVSADVDLKEVYSLCKPISVKACTKEIRSFVKYQLDRRATDIDGGWMYPSSEIVAGWLIQSGLAAES